MPIFTSFTKKHAVFSLTLFFLLGILLKEYTHISVALCICITVLIISYSKPLLATSIFIIVFLGYVFAPFYEQPSPFENQYGKGFFECHEIKKRGSKWYAHGFLHHLECGDKVIYNKYARLLLQKKNMIKKYSLNECEGLFNQNTFFLNGEIQKATSIKTYFFTSEITFIRLKSHEYIKRWIYRHTRWSESCDIITALTLGKLENKKVKKLFSAVGLSHLLVISGFHFSLVISVLNILISQVFSEKNGKSFLLITIFAYYFFVGSSPSVDRAFVSNCLGTLGALFAFQFSSLNALGAGVIYTLFVMPSSIYSIGFHLSYLATAGILLLNGPISFHLKKVLLYTPLSSTMNVIYTRWVTPVASISLSVLIPIIPYTLYSFGSFPLLSLIYNIIIPPIFSLLCCMLIVSYPLAFVSHFLFSIVDKGFMLLYIFIQSYPRQLSYIASVADKKSIPIIAILLFLYLFAMYLHERECIRKSPLENSLFIL